MSCCGQSGVAKAAAGAVGLAQAAAVWACRELGVELDIAAPEAAVRERRLLCRDCDHRTRRASPRYRGVLTNRCRCKLCSCVIMAKTLLAGQDCPAGKWPKV